MYLAGILVAILIGVGCSCFDHWVVNRCGKAVSKCSITYYACGITCIAWTVIYLSF